MFLTVVLGENPDPFAMPLGNIGAPEIPAGKNLYVDLKGAHYLFNFPLPLTYGDACRSMYMIQDGSYVCCISHTLEVQVGDRVPV